MSDTRIRTPGRAASAKPPHNLGPLMTPSASPSLERLSTISNDGPSPKKKRRFSSHTPSRSLSAANPDPEVWAEIDAARRASSMKVLDVWSQLAEKYARGLEDDDIINLRDETIVKDRGVLSGSGTAIWRIGSFADGDHESNGTALQDEEEDDIDEIDAFNSTSRDFSPSELAEEDVVNDSEFKRQLKRIPPVQDRDPKDVEDLRDFLEAEHRRKEEYGDIDEEASTDMDEVFVGTQIVEVDDDADEDQDSEFYGSRSTPRSISLVSLEETASGYSSQEIGEPDSVNELLSQNIRDSDNSDTESDEFGAWTHDEASAIQLPSEDISAPVSSSTDTQIMLATPPSSCDNLRANLDNLDHSPKQNSKTGSIRESKLSTPTKAQLKLPTVTNKLTPNTRMSNKMAGMRITGKHSAQSREDAEKYIPYQTPPWSSPSLQGSTSPIRPVLVDLTVDDSYDSDELSHTHKSSPGSRKFQNRDPTNKKSPDKNPHSTNPIPRRSVSLKPEVVITRRSWSRPPTGTDDFLPQIHTQIDTNILATHEPSTGNKWKGKGKASQKITTALPSTSVSALQPNNEIYSRTSKDNNAAYQTRKKRRRSPSPELYEEPNFERNHFIPSVVDFQQGSSSSPFTTHDSLEPEISYRAHNRQNTESPSVSTERSRSRSTFKSASTSASIQHNKHSNYTQERATTFHRESSSKPSQDRYAHYALAQAISSLSYLMGNNPQLLQNPIGSAPPIEHQSLPWMPMVPPMNFTPWPYPYPNSKIVRQPLNTSEPEPIYHSTSFEASSYDPTQSSPTRGRTKSRKYNIEPRRPKSAIRDSRTSRHTNAPRRSVSFTNPEIISIDGKICSPSQHSRDASDLVYERFSDQHFRRKVSSDISQKFEHKDDPQLMKSSRSKLRTHSSRRAQTPGLLRESDAVSIEYVPDSDVSFSDEAP